MSDTLQLQGIFEQGYGIIPKKVMKDKNLSAEAKAIYAYICSYAGAGSSAFPSVELICADLGFKKPETFRKHRKMLEDNGYIKIHKQRKNGKQANNVYEIIQYPQKQPPEKQVSEKQGAGKQAPEKQTPEKGASNNNSLLNNNSLNNNNVNKIVNKEELIDICNSFYTEFAIGRWNKKQWNILIEKYVSELIGNDKLQEIVNLKMYVKESLKGIAYKHDLKNGKHDLKNRSTDTLFYNWLAD